MEDYLKPGFDPRSLKVAQLRRILIENNVEFPSNSKKALLVRLFEENVAPHLSKLRKTHITSLSNFDDEGASTGSSTKTNSKKRRISTLGSEGSVQDEDFKRDISTNSGEHSSSGEDNDIKRVNKKRKRIGDENENSLISEKVAQKSPSRSPRKSLVIQKFDSSESSSESPSTSFSDNKEMSSPIDLRQLKVSEAYAEELERQIATPIKVSRPELAVQKVSLIEEGKQKLRGSLDPPIKKEGPRVIENRGLKAGSEESEGQIVQSVIEKPKEKEEVEEVDEQEMQDGVSEELHKAERISVEEVDEQGVQDRVSEELQGKERILVEEVVPVSDLWKRSFKLALKITSNLLIFSSIVFPILYGLWYREARILVGYCGQELPLPELPKQLEKLPFSLPKPSCLSCPSHALCYPRMELKCKPEYALSRNPWSLYRLLPLSNSCVKDSKREKLIAEIVDKSLQFLRVKNARVSCGESNDDMKCGVLEDELYQIFYESKTPWINDEEFEDLWIQAVMNLKKDPEITWRQVSNVDILWNFDSFIRIFNTNSDIFWQPSGTEYRILRDSEDNYETNDFSRKKRHFPKTKNETGIFRSTSKKYIGIKCKFENEFYRACYKNQRFIIPFVLGIIVGKFLLAFNRKLRQERLKVDRLTRKVVDRLKTAKMSGEGENPFLSTVQLRDVLLSDIVDLKYKNHLWEKISKILENNNTNIKSNLMEIHGEIMKCWEWIGPLEEDS